MREHRVVEGVLDGDANFSLQRLHDCGEMRCSRSAAIDGGANKAEGEVSADQHRRLCIPGEHSPAAGRPHGQ